MEETSFITPLLVKAIRALVHLIVEKDYQFLEDNNQLINFKASDLKRTIDQYGMTLTDISEAEILKAEVFYNPEYPNSTPIDLSLWTLEEGKSDLMLFLTANITETNVFLQVEDIRVP
jgi:hypothetical protein